MNNTLCDIAQEYSADCFFGFKFVPLWSYEDFAIYNTCDCSDCCDCLHSSAGYKDA